MEYRPRINLPSKNGYSFSFRNSLEKSASEGHIACQQSALNQTMRDMVVQKMQQTPKFIHEGLQFISPNKNINRKHRILKFKRDSLESFGDKNQRLNIQTLQPYFNNNSNTKIGKIEINYNNFSTISPIGKFRMMQNGQNIRSHTTSNPKISYNVINVVKGSNLKKTKPPTIQQIYLQQIREKILSKQSKGIQNNSSKKNIANTTLQQKLVIPRAHKKIIQVKQYNRNNIMQRRLKNDKLKDLTQGLKYSQLKRN